MSLQSKQSRQAARPKCPCGSQQIYSECCEPFLKGKMFPNSPEALMRSRYVAYSKGKLKYIQQTMRGPASVSFDLREARKWAKQVAFIDLKIVTVHTEKEAGLVEFIATYLKQGKQQQMHERSEFQLIEDRWYYYDGVTVN